MIDFGWLIIIGLIALAIDIPVYIWRKKQRARA